jgi:hypothetical protein
VPAWLIEKGERGRAYQIEAEGAIAWWEQKREAELLANEERQGQAAADAPEPGRRHR